MTDARVLRSRAGLRQALLDLLQSQPLDRITIRDVAERAGVGYTTYFRHYPSKEALLDDVAAREIERLCELVLPVYDTEDSAAACLALCGFVEAHRGLWTALLTGGAADVLRGELLRLAREASGERAALGWLPPDLGPALAVSATLEVLSWWLRQAEPFPPDQVADILHRIAISPAEAGKAVVTPAAPAPSRGHRLGRPG